MDIDLTKLTLLQLLEVLLVVAAVDTLSGIFAAVQKGTFTFDLVAQYLQSHVLSRVFPILGLGFLAQTLGGSTGPGAAIWGTALLSLAAYVAETVASVTTNVQSGPTATKAP